MFLFSLISIGIISYLSLIDLRLLDNDIIQSPTTSSVVKFYDAVGGVLMNDVYHYMFEELSMDVMISQCKFEKGQEIVEVGPGSGFLANKVLGSILSEGNGYPTVSYTGVDMSQTMHAKASARLAPYIARGVAQMVLVNDTFDFIESLEPVVDRFVFTYVLDLLPPSEIKKFADVLKSKLHRGHGKICIVNLTYGYGPLTRIISNTWQIIYRFLGGALVGGCRPINSLAYFRDNNGYTTDFATQVQSSGLPSEVVVLSSRVSGA